MNSNSLFKYFFFVFTIASLVACDNDSNEMGTNIVGNDNYMLQGDDFDVKAYTQPLGPVQTSVLGVQQFGIYDDPVFGTTKAHTAVQVVLDALNPDFGDDPQIENVDLTIPYFSHVTQTMATGTADIYELDSIYGPATGKLDLKVYRSGYYLRPDVDNVALEKYYSNQLNDFSSVTIGAPLNNSTDVKQNTAFEFTSEGSVENTTPNGNGETTQIKVGPRMKLTLDKSVFQSLLFGPEAAGKFVDNGTFTNYFRGLLFKVDRSGSADPRLALLNFAGGSIAVTYTSDGNSTKKTLILRLTQNSVNLLEYAHSAEYQNVLNATPNRVSGDEKLYIKGGEGSMAVIELFQNKEEILKLRATKGVWLVNDARLDFYVENATNNTLGGNAPNRIYLYDLNNNRVLVDYTIDQTLGNSVKYNKNMHGGIIDRVSDARGTLYRIRITNHIKGIINAIQEDTKIETVRLGLVVTENINITSIKSLKTPQVLNVNSIFGTDDKIEEVPTMSVANPFGTVLWGTNIPFGDPNYDKRLKLTIHFTKPN